MALTASTPVPTACCILCGATFLRATFDRTDGFCLRCCDPFPRITGPKHLLSAVTAHEIDAELSAHEVTARATLLRWQRIKARLELGDTLVRFISDLQSPAPVLHHGIVWQRGAELLSGIVTRTEWITGEDEWVGEQLRFATRWRSRPVRRCAAKSCRVIKWCVTATRMRRRSRRTVGRGSWWCGSG